MINFKGILIEDQWNVVWIPSQKHSHTSKLCSFKSLKLKRSLASNFISISCIEKTERLMKLSSGNLNLPKGDSASSKMILWWHLLNKESSTADSLSKLKLVVKIASIQKKNVLIMCIGWLISWLYPAIDVKGSNLCLFGKFLSRAHYLKNLALNSPNNIEQPGFKSFILERYKLKSPQKSKKLVLVLSWRSIKTSKEATFTSRFYFNH